MGIFSAKRSFSEALLYFGIQPMCEKFTLFLLHIAALPVMIKAGFLLKRFTYAL